LSDINESKRAEEALKRAHNELEQRVAERTEELGRANAGLLVEIDQRKQAEEQARAAQTETQRLLALSDQSRRTLLSAAEALQNSEARYRTLFEDARDGMALADAETGRLVDCNRALCRMLERNKTELVGQLQTILYPPETDGEKFPRTFRQHQTGDSGLTLEDRFLSKSGQLIPVEIRAARIRMNDCDFLMGIFLDITERKQAEDALHQSTAELHALARHLNAVREEERATLARELHDNLGQHLTALQIDLTWLDRSLQAAPPPDLALLHDRIVAMVPMVERLIELTQTVCASLRPGVLDDLGLVAAIEWQAEDTAKRTGLTCATALPVSDIEVDETIALVAFRIVQESLTNVVRHAQATHVNISLHTAGDVLELEIQDNGRGGAPETVGHTSLGLIGMRERASACGGTVDIGSEPGKGTTVRVRMPARPVRSGGQP
jgi:PAS domain S-box-containing protein